MSRKVALIIGNSEYEDERLSKLVTPSTDASALAQVLRDPEIGGFDQVECLINQPATIIRRAVAGFFVGQERDDLLLLYFSGHGIRDDRGQLFLAAKDTEHNLLRGTAIPATFITEEMDNSRSRRQILILDCCHSGAFSRGMKGSPGTSVGTSAVFGGTGSGRVVLTATDSTQYAWEGERVIGKAENSVFTHYLIQGLQTGEADTNADGRITLDELYNYVYEQVVYQTSMQTPSKWSYGQRGEIVLARNPRPVEKSAQEPVSLGKVDLELWARKITTGFQIAEKGISKAGRQLMRVVRGNWRLLLFSSFGWALAVSLGQVIGEIIARVEVQRGIDVQISLTYAIINRGWLIGFTIGGAISGFLGGITIGLALRRIKQFIGWGDVLLIVLAWAIGLAITGFYDPISGEGSIGAMIGGVMTGLVLQGNQISMKLHKILMIVIVMGLIIAGIIDIAGMVMDSIPEIGAIVSGIIIVMVLCWAERSIRWKQMLILFIGWNFGWQLFSGDAAILGLAIIGLTMWLVLRKSLLLVQWKHVLLAMLGWTISIVVGLNISDTVYSGAWQPGLDESSIIIFQAVSGIIGGVIAGAIGCVVMLWSTVYFEALRL